MPTIDLTVSWGQIITIFLTQSVSTVTTFYMLRLLNVVHHNKENKKKGEKEKDI